MFTFLKRFFGISRPESFESEDTVYEYWQTDFSRSKQARFITEETDSYQTAIKNALKLAIRKRHVFAWTVNPLYRYHNLVLEAQIEFPDVQNGQAAASRAGAVAAGFNIRYLNESTFYSILVSNEGMIRMDAVLNGLPLTVLGWTAIPEELKNTGLTLPENQYSLRIIAQGTSFTLILNDIWIAECEDDSIQAPGKVAFAAQNWGETADPVFALRALTLDSRPYEIETAYTRWNQYLPVAPASRIALARSWYAMGKYVPALIELKRAWKKIDASIADLLLAARIYQAQNMLSDAEEYVLKALEKDSANTEAITLLCSLLYIGERANELQAVLDKTEHSVIEGSAFLSNLQ